ncbi:MAG: hypothetical protein M3Z95_06835 [Actinomycetota bacterium]|nr:hypothetical protein [Actinomycetota bacterium]
MTFSFTGFPEANNNTVTETVTSEKTVIATETFTFNGSSGSNTVPIVLAPGHHPLDGRAKWNVNGVKGGRDHPVPGGVTCTPMFTLQKLQKIGAGIFTPAPLNVEFGQAIEYEVIASNSGNVALTFANANFSDPHCDEGTISGGPAGGTATLGPGESTSYLCRHLWTVEDLIAGSLTNVATDSATPAPGAGETIKIESNPVLAQALDAAIVASAHTLAPSEGASANAAVASFTDAEPSAKPSDYSATIEWGDGASSSGRITAGEGSFSVRAAHAYTEEGSYPVKIFITDVDEPKNTAVANSTAIVADSALTAKGVTVTSPANFTGEVASFTDEDPGATVADFSATVEWGDGRSSRATVSASGSGFAVTASHAFASAGSFKAIVKVADEGGASDEAKSRIVTLAPAPGPATTPTPATTQTGSIPTKPAGGVLGFRARELPAPVFGHTANLIPISGVVLIKLPGSNRFIAISSARSIPLGTIIDTTRGRVQLVTTHDATGHAIQRGVFYGGIFRVTQITVRQAGVVISPTLLVLVGPLPRGCRAGRKASLAARRTTRKLWGDAHGNYRTVGRYAGAAVRGTRWLTEDSCAGTLITVTRGVLSVNDVPHHRVVVVRAPHSLLSHPGRGG